MPPEAPKLLEDIRQAADRIQRFTAGQTLEGYGTDEILRLAVERLFEIIGEALIRLVKLDARLAAQITDYRRIIDFRNVLVHGYDLIDDRIVWDAVQLRLPVLRQQVENLLSGFAPP